MKKRFLAYVAAMGAVCFAGCAGSGESSDSADVQSSASASQSSSSQSSQDAASSAGQSSSDAENQSSESLSSESSDAESGSSFDESTVSSQPGESAVYVSTCNVPSWGVNSAENVFVMGSEYETYRVLETVRFENGAVKSIKAEVYVVSEEFDMESFKEKWGFEPKWNGSFYEGEIPVPESFAGKTEEEVKLSVAEPILKKYGASSYDGFPGVVMVEPSVPTDPAIEF